MSTSEAWTGELVPRGFTAVELLLGLTLTVVLALAIMPLMVNLETLGSNETDRAITLLQGRVAAARMERDLRTATAGGSPFAVETPIVEAGPSQLVFLGHADDDSSLDLLEWELTGDRLMRRWGVCPVQLPDTFGHQLYVDNKSILEGLSEEGVFSYVVNGENTEGPISEPSLFAIESVVVRLAGRDAAGAWADSLVAVVPVGR